MNYHQLSQQERYTITALRITRHSNAEIARSLRRAPSTISRELQRNRKPSDGKYRAEPAHSYATARRRRERRGFHLQPEQWQQVIDLLQHKWSPEQIANILTLYGSFTVSHETIYQYIYADKRQGGTLYRHLRLKPKLRRKRYNSKDSRGRLAGKRLISERPQAVEDRQQFGHWEGDTVMGKDAHHCVLTLVERKTGLAILRKLDARTTAEVTHAAGQAIGKRPEDFTTLTLDNGTEFHDYKALEERFPLRCYFATPYHAWERGSNENLNGLLRQYLPKGMCLSRLTQAQCDWIAHQLNTRPRKRHGYRTPLQVYRDHSHSLHFNLEPKHYDRESIMLVAMG